MTKLKMIPCSHYDVPWMEWWLEEQSRKGYHFKNYWGAVWAEFWVNEPREYRYRLEPCGKKDDTPDGEVQTVYRNAGWDYQGTVLRNSFRVWRSADPLAQEVHTDPVAQGYGYDWLQRRIRRNTVITSVLVLLELAWLAWIIVGANLTVRAAIRSSSNLIPQLAMLFAMITSYLYADLSDLLAMRRLRNSLRAGVAPTRQGRRILHRKIAWWLLTGCLMVYLVFVFWPGQGRGVWWSGAPADAPPVPHVFGTELGGPPQENVDIWLSRYLLADYITVDEGEGSRYFDHVDEQGHEWFSYYYPASTEMWDTITDGLGRALTKELTEELREEHPGAERLSHPAFETVWYAADETGRQYLLIGSGKYVLQYDTTAPADLREHLELFAAVLAREYNWKELTD